MYEPHSTRNLSKDLVLNSKRSSEQVQDMFEERWEKINKGKYDLQELVKPPGLKSDKKTRLKEANHNIKEVMY